MTVDETQVKKRILHELAAYWEPAATPKELSSLESEFGPIPSTLWCRSCLKL